MDQRLRYGFDYDRKLLLDIIMATQTIIPVVNILLIHPTVLFLVKKRETMQGDIRIGYFSTVVGLMLSDAILFGLRVHLLSPFAGAYCGGPLCRDGMFDAATLSVLVALTVVGCFPFFLFLTMRMHQMVLRGTSSRWLLSTKSQIIVFVGLLIIILLNLVGFALAQNSEKAATIAQCPELSWMSGRGGSLLIFGDFGQPEHIKYELVILICSIVSNAPIVIAFSMHSISHLKECRKNLISNRTLQMTNQMLEVFHSQLKGAVLHIFTPILIFLFTTLFDTRQMLPGCGHATLRCVTTMLFVTNPLQFSLVFILKSNELEKLLFCIKKKQFIHQNSPSDLQYGSTASNISAGSSSTSLSLPLLRWR